MAAELEVDGSHWAVDATYPRCATEGCHRVIWRRGLCGPCYRRAAKPELYAGARDAPARGLEEEPLELEWSDPRPEDLRRLIVVDRLLAAIEASNLADRPSRPAPRELVAAYHAVGGEIIWGRRPSGGELHSATLDLQERYMRRPMTPAAILGG